MFIVSSNMPYVPLCLTLTFEARNEINMQHQFIKNNLGLIECIDLKDAQVDFEYNTNGQRISKRFGKNVTLYTYDEDRQIISEIRGDYKIEYQYTNDVMYGFKLNGAQYYFQKDSDFTVIGITNSDGESVAKYDYDTNGLVSTILGQDNSGNWIDKTGDIAFVGTINLIRLHSFYFDVETDLYYNGLSYYDSRQKNYVGMGNSLQNIDTIDKFLESDPFRITANDPYNSILAQMLPQIEKLALDPNLIITVSNWVTQLMNTSSFGAPISYSSSWYSNLSDVELLTRLIYGENTAISKDQNAVGWILINRKSANSTAFYTGSNTYRNIAIKPGQFEPITGGSDSSTANARMPDTSSLRWSNAVWIACSLLSTTLNSDYIELITKPDGITTQKFFLGLSYALTVIRDKSPGPGLEYNFGGSTYYTLTGVTIVFEIGSSLKNPANKATITGNTALDTVAERNTHNIFFDY